jgi:hypothetical protein
MIKKTSNSCIQLLQNCKNCCRILKLYLDQESKFFEAKYCYAKCILELDSLGFFLVYLYSLKSLILLKLKNVKHCAVLITCV